MGAPNLIQNSYIFADDDAADPDDCTYDSTDVPRANQAKLNNFVLRLQVDETNNQQQANTYAQVWVATSSEFGNGPFQVTTTTLVIGISSGTVAEAQNCSTNIMSDLGAGWVNGYTISKSAQSPKFVHAGNTWREHAFCLQFDNNAGDNTVYWLRQYYGGMPLDTYASEAKVTTAAGAGPTDINVYYTDLQYNRRA